MISTRYPHNYPQLEQIFKQFSSRYCHNNASCAVGNPSYCLFCTHVKIHPSIMTIVEKKTIIAHPPAIKVDRQPSVVCGRSELIYLSHSVDSSVGHYIAFYWPVGPFVLLHR